MYLHTQAKTSGILLANAIQLELTLSGAHQAAHRLSISAHLLLKL